MTCRILKKKSEVARSRAALRSMKASCLPAWPVWFLRRHGLLGGLPLGDPLKSWDILNSLTFLAGRLPREAPVLDIGAYASEILCSLHRMGFSSLSGMDLNPGIRKMPYPESIRYEVGDFLRAPFADRSFDAITAISVIEHGLDPPCLLREISRMLRPGGYFVASFDYWPDKIATDGMKVFGMDWTIFSREDVSDLLAEARRHGLAPVGDIELDAEERVVRWGGKSYTFGWIALGKTE